MTRTIDTRLRTLRVLIADDDPSILKFLADRCARMGFEVDTAGNGLQAFALAHRRPPDILITDINMPEVDGLSLCARLLAPDKRPLDVVVITSNPPPDTVERCDSYGATYARKGPDLWDTVQAALTGIAPGVAAEPAARAPPTGRVQVGQRPRVLIVDDDPDVGSFLCSRLAKCGVEALFAGDGIAGYRMARDARPIMIVTDYYMPNGDALYLLWKLRSTPATDAIPVFVMSGRSLDEMAKANLQREFCGRPGATRLFGKPLVFDEIVAALQKYCTLDIAKPEVTRW